MSSKTVKEPQTLEEALEIIKSLLEDNEHLEEQIKLMRGQRFGKKTEVINKNQLTLFDYEENSSDDNKVVQEAYTETKVIHHRAKVTPSNDSSRQRMLDKLKQCDITHKPESTVCSECGEEMQKIGVTLSYRETHIQPAEIVCHNHYEESYKCNSCHPKGNDKIIHGGTPSRPLFAHSYISGSVMAMILHYKYELALPTRRQQIIWRSYGLPLDTKQMSSAIIKVALNYLQPLYDKLRECIMDEKVIHMDETPFKVLEVEERQMSFFWALRTTQEFSKHDVAYFRYSDTRGSNNIAEIINNDFAVGIMCDGHRAYNSDRYPNIEFGTCVVHIRRPFVNIIKALKGMKNSKAKVVVRIFRSIFKSERSFLKKPESERTPENKLRHRQKYQGKITILYEYLNSITAVGALKKAINHANKQRSRLEAIFKNPYMPLTNNPVEQAIRPSTLIRKNSLFAKSRDGAEANAVMYTLVQTAKLNGLDVLKYFQFLMRKVQLREPLDVMACLPWSREAQMKCTLD
ncbi:IS66 family transposase [Ligilactobacillus equi]|uniref:Transposase IS66 n=1 Tax=Ligilactobacillus equi DSM 15833 = JCM 10991 TaxID=1423740 RepID=A0A0R1TF62_9LACO|nr:IS66 family transposase [Ligilactobacillus equi]KRL79721.1 transposase IS66 [Ligilactobacillus equi DSM 15833 = JCM 10991]